MSMETLQAHDIFSGLLLILVTALLCRQLWLLGPFKRRSTTSPSLPCPGGLPLLGNLHQLGALPHDSLAKLAAKHAAPLMLLRLGSVPTLVVSSADALRAVFQHNDRALSGRPALYAATRLSYGLQDITFAPPDGFWLAARRACQSELLGAPRVRRFRDVREAEAAALVAAVTDESSGAGGGTGAPVNLSDKVFAATNKIVRLVAFGDDSEGASIDARAVLEETQRLLGAFFVTDYVPWLGWLDALRGLRRRLERNFRELDAFYERVIDEHINKRGLSKEEDLVDVLLHLHGDPAHRSTFGSRNQIKGVLTDMLNAGTGTSAAVLEWTMTELIRHPEVLAKVQHEVRSVAGDKDMVQEPDLPRLNYLKLVIKESLRLHPPAPLLVPRETTEPCLVRGHAIPAKTLVLINAKAIGADPAVWGSDASRFVPERHDGDGVDDLTDHRPWRDGFTLVPFGIGRRSCPGVHFATAVVELLLANLLLGFDWRAPRGEVDVEELNGLTVHRKNPLLLVAERISMK